MRPTKPAPTQDEGGSGIAPALARVRELSRRPLDQGLPISRDRLLRLVIRGLALAWLVVFWIWLIGAQSTFLEVDAEAYWGFDLTTLYQGVRLGDQDAFLYSPVVAWLFAPFSNLSFEVFYALLAGLNLAALVWLLRPELAALSLFLVPISNEVARGNIHLLLAVAIVVGFRHSAAWAWVLLAKASPGVGLLWFAVRREWRQLGTALAVTAAIVAITFVIDPDLWLGWFSLLVSNVETTRPSVLEIPVLPRLAAAAGLVAVGAWRNRPAIVPVAAMLALPAIWVNSLAMLVAIIPLWRWPERYGIRPVPVADGTSAVRNSRSNIRK